MGKFLKHDESSGGPRRGKKPPQPAKEQPAPSITVDVDMSGVETELANLAHSIKSYVVHAYDAENKIAVFTGPTGSGYHPVLVAFEPSDTMDRIIEVSERIATAFERIADALDKPKAA